MIFDFVILFILFFLKILITKIIKIFTNKIDILHLFSIIGTLLIFNIINIKFIIYSFQNEKLYFVFFLFILMSLFLVHIPGAIYSSLRLKILLKIISKKKRYYDLRLIFNDSKLFENRFSRLKRYKLIKIKNKKIFFNSKKLYIYVKFIQFIRRVYKIINCI